MLTLFFALISQIPVDVEKARAAEKKDDGNCFTQVEIADLWIRAFAKGGSTRQECFDRANLWLGRAWPSLDEIGRLKNRPKLERLNTPLVQGKPGKIPPGWTAIDGPAKAEMSAAHARSGAFSVRLVPSKDGKLYDMLRSPKVGVTPGKPFEISVWVLSDGTDSQGDKAFFFVEDASGKLLEIREPEITPDVPAWKCLSWTGALPDRAAKAGVGVLLSSTKGAVFVDDVSIKVEGKELLQGGSFEGK